MGGLRYSYGTDLTKPIKINNVAGQFVTLTWLNGRVSTITDPAGGVWTYQYNAAGRLATVTSPGSPADVRTYHYEDAASNTRLTGISINNVRYSTYKYHADGRVQESGLAGGEQKETFAYGTNSTTVTDAQGQATTYNFVGAQGALKLASASRAATSTCAAAVASTVYDASGWVDYTLDWNGNKTDYSYDTAGKLLSVTRGAGTSAALTEVNTWNGDLLSYTTFRSSAGTDYARTTYTYVPSGSLGVGNVASVTTTDLRTGAVRQTTYVYAYHANSIMSSLKTIQGFLAERPTRRRSATTRSAT